MDSLIQQIIEKLQNLPETAIKEVLELVNILECQYQNSEQISMSQLEDNPELLLNLKNAITYYQNGISCLQSQDYQQAITEFNHALDINPNFAEAYYSRGKSRQKLNDKLSAIEDFQIAARLFCENNLAEELTNWTPFELGESNREEAIYHLLKYLSSQSSYDEKRLAASAIYKLAKNFKKSCELAIPHLLDNLSEPAPQVRQYVLKALSVINLPNNVLPKIQAIAANDSKEYNRKIAQSILETFNHNQH
jgi:tetratricopeptide (TPR) repeat protein